MSALILGLVFAAAVAAAAGVTLAFSPSIRAVLAPLLPPETARAWCLYARFALFTACLAGGVRPLELVAAVSAKSGAAAAQGVAEVFKALLGALQAGSGTLLLIFGAALAAHAARRVYESLRAARDEPAPSAREPAKPAAVEGDRR